MSDDQKKRATAWISWAALVIFVLYPLSIGPADCILGRCSDRGIQVGLRAVYDPLVSVTAHSATLKALFTRYLALWHRALGDPVD